MTRIELNDTMQDTIIKMCDGNPGAIATLMEIFENSRKIDPQNVLGPLGTFLFLDELGIYGSSIYVLWNDKCGRDVRQLLLLLRACQLGMVPHEKIQELAADQKRKVEIDHATYEQAVLDRLPKFARKD